MTNFAPELFLRFMESKIVLSENTTYAKYFIGNSYLAQISEAQVSFANVTFEPGCRNNWHIHKADNGGGQMLVGVAGRSWMVSGRGQTCHGDTPRHCNPYPRQCQTLAWCGKIPC